jgi:hypothetical protein
MAMIQIVSTAEARSALIEVARLADEQARGGRIL